MWPSPATAAARAVCDGDQPRCLASSEIGAQWSGTSVCKTPTSATAPISRPAETVLVVKITLRIVSWNQAMVYRSNGMPLWC